MGIKFTPEGVNANVLVEKLMKAFLEAYGDPESVVHALEIVATTINFNVCANVSFNKKIKIEEVVEEYLANQATQIMRLVNSPDTEMREMEK